MQTTSNIDVKYVQHCGDDITVVNAARISYGKTVEKLSEKDIKLIKYLAKNRHMSPFEHNSITIMVSCPLYVRSQIHRHRTFSYNELSRRYTDENIEFYTIKIWRTQSKTNKQASGDDISDPVVNEKMCQIRDNAHAVCYDAYLQLLALGCSREQARGVLPQDLMTKFYMTGNLRNFMHFLSLRDDDHAQDEVQIVAKGIREVLRQFFPVSMEALEWVGNEKT